ncbi:RHS repeat-associated core domain-containing protein, partial [Streptomyces sparsogenes]|uniref:RHS repeat-associated core domain-containing protein n=2 Tax=Streptomyces sparsogenes TaxID=67365 RepID=UPI000A681C2D
TERITEATTQREIDQRFFAIVTDLVGTPTELVDESGDIAWHTRTTLWGTTTWAADSSTYTPLRFPGQYYDPETGLHYNHHRYYDPTTARYLTPDPLGLDAGPNACRYVLNPLTAADYLGLYTCKQNADKLRRNMAREGRAPQPGEAAAHIVPSGGSRGHWTAGARSRALLERYGIDINDAANGIGLGHSRPHNYTHRGDFMQRVNQHLETFVEARVDEGYGVRAIRAALRRELRAIGREIESELSSGAPGPNAVWTA